MIRMTLAAFGVTLLATSAPVLAQTTQTTTTGTVTGAVSGTMTCKQQLAETSPHISSMTPSANKRIALDEEGMAKDSLAQHDENACRMHIEKAADLAKQP